jgi:tRNA-guanine family transglycosylase
MANEITGHRLTTMHNLWFFQRHMQRIRAAISAGTFPELLAKVREAHADPRRT